MFQEEVYTIHIHAMRPHCLKYFSFCGTHAYGNKFGSIGKDSN